MLNPMVFGVRISQPALETACPVISQCRPPAICGSFLKQNGCQVIQAPHSAGKKRYFPEQNIHSATAKIMVDRSSIANTCRHQKATVTLGIAAFFNALSVIPAWKNKGQQLLSPEYPA